jgi:hypothetical protein
MLGLSIRLVKWEIAPVSFSLVHRLASQSETSRETERLGGGRERRCAFDVPERGLARLSIADSEPAVAIFRVRG